VVDTLRNVYTIHIRKTQWLFMNIKIFTDRYRFILKVIFGCRIAVNTDNRE
jgi:hypothetical protein